MTLLMAKRNGSGYQIDYLLSMRMIRQSFYCDFHLLTIPISIQTDTTPSPGLFFLKAVMIPRR